MKVAAMRKHGKPIQIGEFLVSQIQENDFPAIQDLYAEYTNRALNPEKMKDAVREFPSCVVRDSGENVLGFAYCFRFAPDIVEIANIYVAQSHRNANLGQIIIEYLLKNSLETTAAYIAVNSLLNESHEKKVKPIGFYKRAGFEVIYDNDHTTVFLRDLQKTPYKE